MHLYKNILEIQSQYGIGAVEFIQKTKFSNSVYYDIKSGKKTKLNPKQTKTLKDLFPEFDFDLLEEKRIIENKESLNSVQNALNFILDNEEELLKHKVFKFWINTKVEEEIAKRTNIDFKKLSAKIKNNDQRITNLFKILEPLNNQYLKSIIDKEKSKSKAS